MLAADLDEDPVDVIDSVGKRGGDEVDVMTTVCGPTDEPPSEDCEFTRTVVWSTGVGDEADAVCWTMLVVIATAPGVLDA